MNKLRSNDNWLSRLIPFGLIGQTKPRHYTEMLGVLWENKTELPYAWNILKHGVCDGCSLGPYGLRDNVMDGIHLCMTRLKLLKLNTMGALDMAATKNIDKLRTLGPEKLRSLGRIPYPMIRHHGDPAFTRISWDDTFSFITEAIRRTPSHRLGFFATSRGLTNEVYYVFQKLARVLGTNNVDLCSRLCHAASVSGLKATLGFGAPTCSLSDFIGTELL
ncbi:MAG TPA: molybdopterin-dependent oxidoreductase, partial [Terriglobales bacterium]|nr:molybdopterin-dependent oxidoreductase [Terriglobales bacterium]